MQQLEKYEHRILVGIFSRLGVVTLIMAIMIFMSIISNLCMSVSSFMSRIANEPWGAAYCNRRLHRISWGLLVSNIGE